MNKFESKDVKHGEKTIKLTAYLYTNNLGEIGSNPKVTWNEGVVRVNSNRGRGISQQPPIQFNGIANIAEAISKALHQAGIVIVDADDNKGQVIVKY